MSSTEPTSGQKIILTVLANLYWGFEDTVKGEDIAAEVNRNPGTIRNQIWSLRALQLVKGALGPKDGYKPTASAYEAPDVDKMDEPVLVPLLHNDEEVEGVNADEIGLSNVHHPELRRVEIHAQGSVYELHEGDKIRVDPTPLLKLVIDGTLDGKDDTNNILILHINDMQVPAGRPQH